MKQIFEEIKTIPLFQGIPANDLESMLSCVQGQVRNYEKGNIIQLSGDPVENVGVVISGTVQVVREDDDGKQNLMAELGAGELFGEVFACAGIAHSPVTVLTTEHSEVLHINYRRVISTCPSACLFHQRLIENMLSLLARKNLMLTQKIELLAKRTTRERLLLYFDQCRNGNKQFSIPYSRDELAAYLCVDRSAMSAELSRMQHDGLIRYNRNHFELL